jgi:putative transposase
MKRRQWKPEQKALIVLERLKGRPIGELCAEHEIRQTQYHQWRDLFLANAARAFKPAGAPQRQGRLERENARLKALVGELAVELQKKRGGARLMRGPYAKVAARNGALLERVRELNAGHPFWGYRGVWAYLRYVDRLGVNQRRVYGTMKANDLLVRPNPKLLARRKADTRKPRPTQPNEWWGIDMTKTMIEGFGWVYVVVVLDWHSKKVVGYHAGLEAGAWHWLVALNRAVNR